jgi:hypothetical protein
MFSVSATNLVFENLFLGCCPGKYTCNRYLTPNKYMLCASGHWQKNIMEHQCQTFLAAIVEIILSIQGILV